MNLRSCLYFAFKIKDGLFIGDINSPNERDFLVSNKITCIVNCAASQIKPINLNLGIKFISFDWLDNDDQIIIDDNNENMSLIYEFMSRAYENCESVLVCSVRGQSRALTVITAFLMKRYQWSLYKTLEYMNSKRADFEIRATFLKQLLTYEQKLFGQKGCSRNWKDDHQHPDQEASLVRNTYVNSQMISLESRDFFMRSLASREYNSGPRTTKLKWSIQLKMEIPHHEDIQSLNRKQNINQQNQSNSNNQSINSSQNNSGSNQSMKNNSNCTASNSSNQMDSVEILPINQNAFQVPKKSILKAVSSYDKKNINNNSTSSQGQNSISSLSEDSLQNNQSNQSQKKKEVKKISLQKNYDLIEEQNEEYEQSSSEVFLTKQNQKNSQIQQSSLPQKPLNELEKELLVEQQQSSRSYETNSSGERVEQGINIMLESDAVKNSNDFETNRLNSNQDEEVPPLKQPIKQKDRNEIKIFEQNSDRFPKAQINPPAAPTYAQNQKPDFQIQKEKMKNNYFREENTLQDQNKSTPPQQPENSSIKISSQKNNQREEVRVIAVEESDNNQDGVLTEQYKLNYQINESNLDKKNNNLNSIVNKNGSGGYQILNDQQIKNSINLSQYQINSRQTQSLVSQPGSNSSSRQTTPSRKYRKSPFPMAMPQRKIIQSQTAPQSRDNSRKNSVAQIDQGLQIQQQQGNEKKQNGVKQIVSKSPDSSQVQVNINLNINSVNILNQTTNPIYQRQKSPADSETQNNCILQPNFGKISRKSSRPPSETKKRPVTEKVYTEGNQIKDLELMKPQSTKLTRRLQTYTNGDPLNFLPNITFMRQRTPLKNNINLPNTQNLVPKPHKNLELSFQDITTTPNNQAYLQSFTSNNPNSQQLYTNYLNDVDISSQQNTVKSNTSKLKGFKRDNTPVTRVKIPVASPYNNEIRSSSNFDQRRVSTEIGQTRGSSEIRSKRSVSRGKEKDLNNTFSYLNTPINNSGTNTPISTGINPQLMAKYIKNGIKPSYNKLLY
ncbi:dual specificity phosphatase domain protein (macronuclear) [Tetrahymena thermophila SB210]|uniref:Dual specificity phosphatase domain protein n=1 Tax=Tetrahymena thermophila (strain SB210) TaxID=312017 RepID=Q24I42_TETTS|nr:dual specificity phosphatase domain protein [Tetrahymena thermophila SB210]EAS07396.2 dual specificity phosphatase domain protein [Tetrahymena thermophila SB210]|eukprot:XP_001027638.2 dual specificity phosphatase domain protein [Tetrahymena thermophila SB210]